MYYLSGAGHQQPYFIPRQVNFLIKNILHFWTMCNSKNPYNPGYFTYCFAFKLVITNVRVPLSPTTQFSTSRSPPKNPTPKYPKIVRELLRRTFEKSFISNNFQLPKNPQSHRITLKSHPKIIKSQIKPTHSRTKSNNPVITTKTHTTPPSRHTKNHHKNKAKTHIKALTQYAKTSLL